MKPTYLLCMLVAATGWVTISTVAGRAETTVTTYWEGPGIHCPLIAGDSPEWLLKSPEFWDHFSEANPQVSGTDVSRIRSGIEISLIDSFPVEDDYFGKWKISIQRKDYPLLEQILASYKELHRDRFLAKKSELIVFYEKKRLKFKADYKAAKLELESQSDEQSQNQVAIALSNFNQLEKQISEFSDLHTVYEKTWGRIVESASNEE